MNAFTRMFYEPKASKPTLSASRLAGIPLIFFGIVWMVIWTIAAATGRNLPLPWWAGMATICVGATLYLVNKFSAGPVSVEFSGPVEKVEVTHKEAPKEESQ